MKPFINITKNYVIITILTIIILVSIIHYANFLSIIEGYTNTKKSNTTQTTQTGQSSNQKKQADLAITILIWILIIIAIIIVLFILFYLSKQYLYYRNNNYGQGYITPVGTTATTSSYQGQPGSTIPNLGIAAGVTAFSEFVGKFWQGGKRIKSK